MEEYGYIYVLTNESMPGLVKIGVTTNIKERLRTLDTTGVPTPFKLYYAIKVSDYKKKEQNLHKVLINIGCAQIENFLLWKQKKLLIY